MKISGNCGHRWTLLTLLSVGLLLPICALNAAPAARPNILWLVSEDNTTLLGCYGDRIARTPTLDKLAAEGVLFESCFAQPVCAPSRFTLITGMPAVACGPANNMRAEGKIPPWLKGFPAILKRAGYYTANNAKTDYNSPINVKQTWDESSRKAHYRNRPDATQPFFSVFNFETTHESCLFPEKEVALDFKPTNPADVRVPAYLPDTPEIRADTARYYNHLTIMDGQVKKKLDELEKAGLADDTIVFYYADNGGVIPRSKRFLQCSGTHVPLIVRFPPKWQHLAPASPGSRLTQPVSFLDFAPTVLSLAGLQMPDYMTGRAFAGPRAATNSFVFCTRDRMDEQYDTVRSATDGRWLYIRNLRPDIPYVCPLEYMFRARGYQSWAKMASQGRLTEATSQFWGTKPPEELYDLSVDPDNVHNLATDRRFSKELERMQQALQTHILDTKDNGLLPEGSALEGYEASRAKGAYPVSKVYQVACLASQRDPRNLPSLARSLEDPCEPVRWWAAQGCAMLDEKAAAAKSQLSRLLDDPSGAVQIAAAEALARQGQEGMAMPVLIRWVHDNNNLPFALQAANVLNRLGPKAKPALGAMKAALEAKGPEGVNDRMEGYVQRMLNRSISILEGSSSALVYPPQALGKR